MRQLNMQSGDILYWLVEIAIGLYMVGVGFKIIPDPGKKDSKKNTDFFERFRNFIKFFGICILIYAALTIYVKFTQ